MIPIGRFVLKSWAQGGAVSLCLTASFFFFRAGPRLTELPPIANTTEIQNYFQQERKLFFWTKPESPFDFVLIARRVSPD